MTNSFFDNYMLYASGNEASPMFHKWGALSVLSAVISRKVWFDQKYFKLYPNIYVVFVGEPGDKKTTALSLARSMAQKLEVPIAPPSATKESITQIMGVSNENSPTRVMAIINNVPTEISHYSFFASEIVTLLNAGNNPQGMIEFFTDIYDREAFEVLTKHKGHDFINSPYITILACMTPEQTGQLLKERLITGGFSRRCIFVYGRSRTEPMALLNLTQAQEDAKLACLSHLRKLKTITGEYKMDEAGKDFYVAWYAEKHKQLAMPHTAVFKNWLRSKDAQLIKVAMLLDLAGPMQKVLTVELLQQGVKLLDETETHLNKVLAGAGKNPLAELAYKIFSRLEEAPDKMLSKKQLIAALFEDGDLEQIDKAMDYLLRTDVIVRKMAGQLPNLVEMIVLNR